MIETSQNGFGEGRVASPARVTGCRVVSEVPTPQATLIQPCASNRLQMNLAHGVLVDFQPALLTGLG